jgi:hypothetical protein
MPGSSLLEKWNQAATSAFLPTGENVEELLMLINTWSRPVQIELGPSGSRSVNGPFEAMIYLTDLWPNRSGLHFIRARNACKAAVAGRKNPEDARSEFLAAAKEIQDATR